MRPDELDAGRLWDIFRIATVHIPELVCLLEPTIPPLPPETPAS
jgi:hypothetical protein